MLRYSEGDSLPDARRHESVAWLIFLLAAQCWKILGLDLSSRLANGMSPKETVPAPPCAHEALFDSLRCDDMISIWFLWFFSVAVPSISLPRSRKKKTGIASSS